MSLLISGCIFNKKTGKVGPSWQVPLRVPLIATNTNVTKLLENTIELTTGTDDILQAESLLEKTLRLDTLEFDFKPIEIKIDTGDIITPPGETSFTLTSKLDLHKLITNGSVDAIHFNSGSMQVELNSEAHVSITKVEIQGQEFVNPIDIPLADLMLKQNDTIKITGTIPGGTHNIKNLKISFMITTKDIHSITGKKLRFKLPNETIALDFPLPKELDKIEFNQAELNLSLDYHSSSGNLPKIDLRELEISQLKMPEDAIFFGKGEFTFAKDEVTKLLNSRPNDIQISGYLIAGTDPSPVTINFTDTVDLQFTVVLPLQFKLSEDVVYESEVTLLDVGDISLEDLMDAIHAEVAFDYQLPLGAQLEIYISNENEPFKDLTAIVLQASMEAAPTNEHGMTTESKTDQIVVKVPEKITTTLMSKSYAQMRLTIPVPSNDLVTFTSNDFVNIKAWLELWANVNK